MISRLLEVKSSVVSVCEEIGWESQSSYQWKQLEVIEQLLKLFAQYSYNINSWRRKYYIGNSNVTGT